MRILRWLGYICLFGFGLLAGTYLLIRISFSGTGAVVPPVIGLTQEQAEFQAKRAHLLFAVQKEQYDLAIPKGFVVGQTPSAGMAARKGYTLAVVLSKGIEHVEVPDMSGHRADEAQIGLRQSGLTLSATSFLHSTQPAQVVMAQSPSAGAVVPRDAEASLLLSAGPPARTFVTPDLRGASAQKAQWQLEEYGIHSAVARTEKVPAAEPGTVVGQVPAPGLPLNRQDMVQLVVSQP